MGLHDEFLTYDLNISEMEFLSAVVEILSLGAHGGGHLNSEVMVGLFSRPWKGGSADVGGHTALGVTYLIKESLSIKGRSQVALSA